MNIPNLTELRTEYHRPNSRVHRLARAFMWICAAFALWVLFGFFGLPPILRGQMEKRLGAELGRKVVVEKVRFNPLRFSLAIEGFKIAERDDEVKTWIGWRRLYVNVDTFSLLWREWRVQNIELESFSARVAVDPAGQVNFADLLAKLGQAAEPAEKPKTPWPLHVLRLSVIDSRLEYSDASQGAPFETLVGPTTFSLRDFHTGGKKQAPGEFAATTESGETFGWRGRVSFGPLRSSGDVEVGRLSLKKYAPYYASRVKFDLLDGRLDLAGHYEFSLENGRSTLRLSEGKAVLKSLQIAPRGQDAPVVVLDQVDVSEVSANWPAVSAEVGRVVVAGGSVGAVRTSAGIDLLDLLMPVVPTAPAPAVSLPAAAPAPAPASPPLDVKVNALTVRALAVNVEDQTTPRPAKHAFGDLNFDLRNFTLANPETPMAIGFRSNYGGDGVVHLAGTVSLSPLKAQLGVELTNLSLTGLSPYAETFVNARVARGRLTAALHVAAELVAEKPPVLSAEGEVNVDNFAVYDATEADELVSWRNLAIKGLEYGTEPSKLLATEIFWNEPAGHVIVNADGTNNLELALGKGAGTAAGAATGASPATVSLPKGKAKPVPAPTAGPLGDMQVSVDRFVLEKGGVDFTDRSLQPNVRVVMNQFSGAIEGLSSSEVSRATVDIRGRMDGVTPVTITGKTNPLSVDAFTDMKMTLKTMELAPLGPYVGKFAGYELERGSLSVDVKVGIKRRKVDSANVATINQFTLGNSTNSPDATKLPVKLALALLRDTSGKIVLDVPVQGSLDDPEFRVGRVVWRVVTNLLAKAATSPFALLGSMFGSDKGEELAFQRFQPGVAVPVDEEEIKKLDVIAKALTERPTLRLEIVGGYDEAADAPVLREEALETQMRNIIWNDRRMVDPAVTLDQIQIDPVQKNGMIRRLFYKAFPKEKPKRFSPGEEGYTDDVVVGQRGNLGSFARKKRAAAPAPAPAQRQEVAQGNRTNPDGTTDTTAEVKEVKPLTFEEMKARLLSQITVNEEAFRKLAAERANAVREYLVNHGEVPAERLSLAAITATQPAAKGARVELKLQ